MLQLLSPKVQEARWGHQLRSGEAEESLSAPRYARCSCLLPITSERHLREAETVSHGVAHQLKVSIPVRLDGELRRGARVLHLRLHAGTACAVAAVVGNSRAARGGGLQQGAEQAAWLKIRRAAAISLNKEEAPRGSSRMEWSVSTVAAASLTLWRCVSERCMPLVSFAHLTASPRQLQLESLVVAGARLVKFPYPYARHPSEQHVL